MKKAFKTLYTDAEFRQIIRDELRSVLSGEADQVGLAGDEGYLDIKQAADFVKLVPGTIYQLIHKGKIPYHKNGKRVLFKRSELVAWIKKDNASAGD